MFPRGIFFGARVSVGGWFFLFATELATEMRFTYDCYTDGRVPSVSPSVLFSPTDFISVTDGISPSVTLDNVVVEELGLLWICFDSGSFSVCRDESNGKANPPLCVAPLLFLLFSVFFFLFGSCSLFLFLSVFFSLFLWPSPASIKPENGLSSRVRASRSWGTNASASLRRNRGRKFALLCLVRFPVLFLFSSPFFFLLFSPLSPSVLPFSFPHVTFRSLDFIAREQCRFNHWLQV